MTPFTHKKTPTKIRLMASAATVVFAACMPVHGALAQDQDNANVVVEEVVVTGSRIRRTDLEAPSPVTVVSAVDLVESGETDISELLRNVPALNSTLTASQSALTADSPNGVGQLDLRGLGVDRTLVLVNGRRHVSGVQGSAAVDVSTIPLALIESIETVTGAGATVYGSDAVSGVVNFNLKDDFEGVDYRGQFSISDNGDAENYFAALTLGSNFADDRGNAVISIEYARQESIVAQDRDFAFPGLASLIPNSPEVAAAFGLNPDADNVFVPNVTLPISSPFGTIALFGSAFGATVGGPDFDGPNIGGVPTIGGVPIAQVIDETGTLRPFDFGVFSDGFNASGGDGIGTTFPTEVLIPDIERVVVNANTNYKVNSYVTAFLETKFAFTSTLDSDGVNGFNDDIPIAADNAFIPAALQAQIDDLTAQGFSPEIVISRDQIDDLVRPETESDRYTFRAVGGLRGELDNGWRWEASFNYGRTEVNETFINTRIEDRFFAGVDAVVDPDTGNIVCRSDLDPTAVPPVSPFPTAREGFLTFDPGDGQCAPINIFGLNQISAEGAAFAFIPVEDNEELEQRIIQVLIDGDSSSYFELPAGPVAFSAGFEYREEESEFSPSDFETAGLIFNSVTTAVSPVEGDFDVTEFYGEVAIPLVRDVFLVESLSLEGSARYSDYSTVGSVFTWAVGASWQVTDDIRFRGAFNRSVRAPNVFELFSPNQPIFLDADADPCNPQNINAGSEFRASNCAALGLSPDFNSTDFVSAFITGQGGGNPDLTEETSDTYTIGLVYTPSYVPGLNVTVDYYNIRIEDAIDQIDAVTLVENCVDAPSIENSFCPLIERDATFGFITGFTSGQTNIAALETEGVDFSADYSFDLESLVGSPDYGNMSLQVSGLYLINNDDFPFQDFPDQIDTNLGELNFPEWIVNFVARWQRENYGLTYTMRFEDSQLLDTVENEEIAGNPLFADPLTTGSGFVHDISAFYNVNENLTLRVSVNNIGDREPFLSSLIRPIGPIGRTFVFNVSGNF